MWLGVEWYAAEASPGGGAKPSPRILATNTDEIHAGKVSLGDTEWLWHGSVMAENALPTSTLANRWPSAWGSVLEDAGVRSALSGLDGFLRERHAQGAIIYPPKDQRFRALQITKPAEVSVVILGQDPYHGPNQAEGLSFSVPIGHRIPPSLRNIYKELAADVGVSPPAHGHLAHWAGQGVLLLNAVLSVEQGQPNAHKGLGWEIVTDSIIRHLVQRERPVVFMLWGAFAQKKAALISADDEPSRHCILYAPHPSPLSARHGFFGCGHFSKANAFLAASGARPIDWQVPGRTP
jgi:uracil-DNA glycosylase